MQANGGTGGNAGGTGPAPRILAIMGSGETAPTMARVHRALFDRFGPGPVPAAILDTPYGFQENADDLSARTVAFFETSVGRPVAVATYRSRAVDALTESSAVARLRAARYVMSGPGSPTYAVRQWRDGPIPGVLAEKLGGGGILTMASAAALTLGRVTLPVYEIYKSGEEPHWVDGLDLLEPATGLRAAVVPHFDNAEGGNHDTRFCYMGERRLRLLEPLLPDGTFILGVDSHTALVLDLDRRVAAVAGIGGVTVRVAGRGTTFPSGSEVGFETIAQVARDLAADQPVDIGWEPESGGAAAPPAEGPDPGEPVGALEAAFESALAGGELRIAAGALLEIDTLITDRIRRGEDSPELDAAAATYRGLIIRLADVAEATAAAPGATIEPLVDTLLDLRARARDARDWDTADVVRERLASAGIEIRDGDDGSSWHVREAAQR